MQEKFNIFFFIVLNLCSFQQYKYRKVFFKNKFFYLKSFLYNNARMHVHINTKIEPINKAKTSNKPF